MEALRYIILTHAGSAGNADWVIKMEEFVQTAIADGWEPLGGIACCTDGGTIQLFQAMVKRPAPADGAAGSQAASPEGEQKA